METKMVKESPAFTLQGSSYNGVGPAVEVSFAELEAAPVGSIWNGYDVHNCGRDLCEESAEVVYKTGRGCAVLFREWGSTDEPTPRHWENEPELMWYKFAVM